MSKSSKHAKTTSSAKIDPSESRDAVRMLVRLATCYNLLMREARQRISDRWSLTLPQFDVLVELARADRDGFTFVELSRLLLVTSGNLTGIIDRLEAQGLVKRQPGQRDRRVVRVKLTPKGRGMTRQMLPRHAEDVADILSFLPSDRLQQLTDLLGGLRDGLHGTPPKADTPRPLRDA